MLFRPFCPFSSSGSDKMKKVDKMPILPGRRPALGNPLRTHRTIPDAWRGPIVIRRYPGIHIMDSSSAKKTLDIDPLCRVSWQRIRILIHGDKRSGGQLCFCRTFSASSWHTVEVRIGESLRFCRAFSADRLFRTNHLEKYSLSRGGERAASESSRPYFYSWRQSYPVSSAIAIFRATVHRSRRITAIIDSRSNCNRDSARLESRVIIAAANTV